MLKLEVDTRGVAHLWLARPEKHNAMSGELISALAKAAADIQSNDAIRVVVLAAEGKTFCAGGDLEWMRQQFHATEDIQRQEAQNLANMLGAFDALSKPVIARVHGNSFGGGLGLMSVCDSVIAVQEARFALTEVKLGLIPATIGPYVVARMTRSSARRYFYSGQAFGADEALNSGLVSKVVAAEVLDMAIEEEVKPYLAAAPGAVASAKKLYRKLARSVTQEEVDASIEALVARWQDPEARAGIAAFFDKERPPWSVD